MSWRGWLGLDPAEHYLPGATIQRLVGHRCSVWRCHPGLWVVTCLRADCTFLTTTTNQPDGLHQAHGHYRKTTTLGPAQPFPPDQ